MTHHSLNSAMNRERLTGGSTHSLGGNIGNKYLADHNNNNHGSSNTFNNYNLNINNNHNNIDDDLDVEIINVDDVNHRHHHQRHNNNYNKSKSLTTGSDYQDFVTMALELGGGVGGAGSDDFPLASTNSLRTNQTSMDDGRKSRHRHRLNDGGQSSSRKSNSIMVVFIFDILLILLLSALAYILKFTDDIKIVKISSDFRMSSARICRFPEEYSYKILNSTDIDQEYFSPLFIKLTDWLLYSIVFIGPIILILFYEILRIGIESLFGKYSDHSFDAITLPITGIKTSLFLRRTFRIIGGFILGFLATIVIIDILKLQTSQYRPYALTLCPELCTNASSPCLNSKEMLEATKSFPSLTSGLSSYTGMFLIFYLICTMNYRGLRIFRFLLVGSVLIVSLLLSLSRLITNHNHSVDVLVGIIIGSLIAIFIAFLHLNAFANRLSNSNFFSTKRKNWYCRGANSFESSENNLSKPDDPWYEKDFRIPRVSPSMTTSLIDKKSGNYGKNNGSAIVQRNGSNAYINPAFHTDNEDGYHAPSSRNYRHTPQYPVPFTLDNNNNPTIKRDNSQPVRGSSGHLRTFQN